MNIVQIETESKITLSIIVDMSKILKKEIVEKKSVDVKKTKKVSLKITTTTTIIVVTNIDIIFLN